MDLADIVAYLVVFLGGWWALREIYGVGEEENGRPLPSPLLILPLLGGGKTTIDASHLQLAILQTIDDVPVGTICLYAPLRIPETIVGGKEEMKRIWEAMKPNDPEDLVLGFGDPPGVIFRWGALQFAGPSLLHPTSHTRVSFAGTGEIEIKCSFAAFTSLVLEREVKPS